MSHSSVYHWGILDLFFFNMFTKFVAVLLAVVVLIAADLDVYFDDIAITKTDPNFIVDPDAWISDDSETDGAVVLNFTITQALPDDTQAHVALVGASMGEYVVQSSVDFTLGMCEMMDEPLLLGPFLSSFGFKKEECPPKPGVYGTTGFILPTEQLPEDFAKNKYKTIFELLSGDNILLQAEVLVEVQ